MVLYEIKPGRFSGSRSDPPVMALLGYYIYYIISFLYNQSPKCKKSKDLYYCTTLQFCFVHSSHRKLPLVYYRIHVIPFFFPFGPKNPRLNS